MANTTVICRELPKHFPYDPKHVSVFSRKAKMSEHSGTDAIAGAIFLAFPLKEKPRILQSLHDTFHASYNNEYSLYICVLSSLQKNGSIDEIKTHEIWLQFVRDHKFLGSGITTKELDYRVTRALRALPAPYHLGTLLRFSEESLALCRELENTNEALAAKLHRYEECTPEDLLPIYNRAAFFVPTGGKDHWVSWGYLLQQFGECVPDQREAVAVTLAKHPCRPVAEYLHFEHPLPHPGILEDRSFRTFVAERTVAALEKAAGLTFPEEVRSSIFHSCLADERLRKNISFHLTYIDQFVDQPIPPRGVGEWADRVHLYTSFRILYNVMHTYVPQDYPSDEYLEELVVWAFKTNCEYIHSLHKPNFPRPEPGMEIADPIIPSEVVPQVTRLTALYPNNGEIYLPNALALALIRPTAEYVDFILGCADLPYTLVTTKNVLDFSPLMDLVDHERKMDVMQQVIPHIHQNLRGRSSQFFSIIPQRAKGVEVVEKIQHFNALVGAEEIESDLYFRVLRLYINGKICDDHFEMFELFDDESRGLSIAQKLDLIWRATEEKSVPPLEEDPPHLHRALMMLNLRRSKEIRDVLLIYEQRVLKGEKLSKEMIQYMYMQTLSKLPDELNESHMGATLGYLKQLSHHEFSKAQHLHLFFEFLSLQENRKVLHQNIQLIFLIEAFIGHHLDRDSVHIFLCYHPDLSHKEGEIEHAFERLTALRRIFLIENIDSPLVNPDFISEIVILIAELQMNLMDSKRMSEFADAHEQVNTMIGTLQFQLSAAIAFPFVTHLLRGFPTFVPVTEREGTAASEHPLLFEETTPSGALIPVSNELNLHKEIYSYWEAVDEGFIYHFSLVTDSDTYSGRALLPLSAETLQAEPTLLSVIKDLSAFLCLDTYHDIHCRQELNFERLKPTITTLDKLLVFNAKAKRVWSAFRSPHKESYAPAVFSFVTNLKMQHRHALLNTATHGAVLKQHESPMRLKPRTFMQHAAIGNIYVTGKDHTLLPRKLLSPHSPHYSYYSTRLVCSPELFNTIDVPETKIGDLIVTENSFDGIKLPLIFSSRARRVEYSYKTKVMDQGEAIDLVDERDAFDFDSREVTLSTTYKGEPARIIVTYPEGRLPSQEAFNHWMGWQAALLKSRFYYISAQQERPT